MFLSVIWGVIFMMLFLHTSIIFSLFYLKVAENIGTVKSAKNALCALDGSVMTAYHTMKQRGGRYEQGFVQGAAAVLR
jgi:hypothetical protein